MSKKINTRSDIRNMEWDIHINDDGTWPSEKVTIALLVDLRAELRRLNTLLHCSNFIDIPHKLERIKRNTTKRKNPVAKGKPKLRVVRS